MAAIYDIGTRQYLWTGQGSSKCDEAINTARRAAASIGEAVRLEDDDGCWDVHPDGHLVEAEPWPWPDVDDAGDSGVFGRGDR